MESMCSLWGPLTLIGGDDANLVGLHSTSHQLKLLYIPHLHSVSARGRGGEGISGWVGGGASVHLSKSSIQSKTIHTYTTFTHIKILNHQINVPKTSPTIQYVMWYGVVFKFTPPCSQHTLHVVITIILKSHVD